MIAIPTWEVFYSFYLIMLPTNYYPHNPVQVNSAFEACAQLKEYRLVVVYRVDVKREAGMVGGITLPEIHGPIKLNCVEPDKEAPAP